MLALVGIAGLYHTCRKAHSYKQYFVYGTAFGVAKFGIGLGWISNALLHFGNLSTPVALAITAAGVLLFAIWLGLAIVLYGWWRKLIKAQLPSDHSSVASALLFVVVFLLYEWTLSFLFGGLPWLSSGYLLLDTPLSGLAAIGGVSILSLVAIGTTVLLYHKRWLETGCALIAAILFALPVLLPKYGATDWILTESTFKRTVGLVHQGLTLRERWQLGGIERTYNLYRNASSELDADLIVWPESGVPTQDPNMSELRRMYPIDLSTTDYFVGSFEATRELPSRLFNVASVFSEENTQIYRKQILVPFGEYTPFAGVLLPLSRRLDIPMSNLQQGTPDQPVLTASGMKISPAICFEIIFPYFLAQKVRRHEAELVVNISEDMWYGNSRGPYQHLNIARMRAIELGKYVVRSANRGISAVINPAGDVVASIPMDQVGTVTADIQVMEGLTPFARLPVPGELLYAALLLISLVIYSLRIAR